MRLISAQVGPLAASSATKICLSQKCNGANALAIDGAASSGYVANNICLSQSAAGAANLTLNGSLAQTPATTTFAELGGQQVVIVSAANDSGITFTVTGTVASVSGPPIVVSEVVTGTNTSRSCTKTFFQRVTQVATSNATAGNVTVGTNGTATLDVARRVLFTDGGNDSSISATVTGTDWNSNPVTEKVTLTSGSTIYTNTDFLTVTSIVLTGAVATTITVGTNGVASSPPILLDKYAFPATALQVTVAGTVNYTVQQTLDPIGTSYPSVTWVNHPDLALVSATTTQQSNYAYVPEFTRITLNSESAGAGNYVIYRVVQSSGLVW